MSTSVVIVDDDAGFRRVAAELLADRGYRVVGEAGNAGEALAKVAEVKPDAVLLDVRLPDGDGINIAAELRQLDNGLRVLLTSTDRMAIGRHHLELSGANGFVPKAELAVVDLDRYLSG
jgi:DNA-binding NarL/FixJ family response regulator